MACSLRALLLLGVFAGCGNTSKAEGPSSEVVEPGTPAVDSPTPAPNSEVVEPETPAVDSPTPDRSSEVVEPRTPAAGSPTALDREAPDAMSLLAGKKRGPALAGPSYGLMLITEEGVDPRAELKRMEARSGLPDMSQIGTGRVGSPPASGKGLPTIDLSGPKLEGPLDKERVRGVVRANTDEIEACYRKGLNKDPSLKGAVVVSFSISPSGTVSRSKVEGRTRLSSSVARCVAEAAKRWKFRGPPRSEVVSAEYLLSFTPG